MKLSIVIPCYNEAENLNLLIPKCLELLTSQPDVEIVLVNNGSTDHSREVFSELLSGVSAPLRLLNIEKNIGYGNGILKGLEIAQAPVLCWTHADLQTDIYDCVKALDIYENANTSNEFVLVKGRRMGRPFVDVFFTKAMSWYVKYKLKVEVSDVNAQPKLFSRVFYQSIKDRAPLDFALDLYFLAHAKKQGIIFDFPVYFLNRQFGEAKGGGSLKVKWKLTKRTLEFISRFTF